jgi:hypothetical protein
LFFAGNPAEIILYASQAKIDCTQDKYGDPPHCQEFHWNLVPTSVSATAIRGTVGLNDPSITGTFALTKQ